MPLAIRELIGGDVATDDRPRLEPSELLVSPPVSLPDASPSLRLRFTSRWSHLAVPFGVATAVILGFYVRAMQSLPKGFPPNDGGLFYVMVHDLQANHYALPMYTSYNSGSIPYAYAPFSFYLAGVLNDITHIPLITLFQIIPLVVTTATILAVFPLARAILSPIGAVVATFVFALIPRSFIWLLMGGGITRSLGFLFAVLALYQVYRLYTTGASRYLFPTIALSSLCVLSHLETGEFLAYSMLIFLFFYGSSRRALWYTIIVGIGVVAVTAPWWGTVLYFHGLDPFRNAQQTGIAIWSGDAERSEIADTLRNLQGTTSEPFFPVLVRLGFLGVVTCVLGALTSISRRGLLLPGLPVWWLAINLLDNRAANTYSTLPIALLAGLAVTDFLFPVLNQPLVSKPYSWQVALFSSQRAREVVPLWISPIRKVLAVIVLGSALVYATNGALQTDPNLGGELPNLAAMLPADRAAMEWVAHETPATSQFLVVSQHLDWTTDKTSEWFPVFAERPSIATAQGYEWLPDKVFLRRIQQHWGAQLCADEDAQCIENWAATTGQTFDYVYIRITSDQPFLCCTLVPSLVDDPRYHLVYSGPGAMIFSRHPTDG